jgi:hypothetical protein
MKGLLIGILPLEVDLLLLLRSYPLPGLYRLGHHLLFRITGTGCHLPYHGSLGYYLVIGHMTVCLHLFPSRCISLAFVGVS